MKTQKRGGAKGDTKPPEKKHVKENPVSKPPISEPPISILRVSKYTNRSYSPLNDKNITIHSDGKLAERFAGFKKKLSRSGQKVEPRVTLKLANGGENEIVSITPEEKEKREQEMLDHLEIINKLQKSRDIGIIMTQIQKEFTRDITEKGLRAIVSQNCRESTRGEPVEIEGWTFDQQNRIMDIIDKYEVTANTAQEDVSDAPSSCNIMGGKRKTKTKTKTKKKNRTRTRRRKTKRRYNLS